MVTAVSLFNRVRGEWWWLGKKRRWEGKGEGGRLLIVHSDDDVRGRRKAGFKNLSLGMRRTILGHREVRRLWAMRQRRGAPYPDWCMKVKHFDRNSLTQGKSSKIVELRSLRESVCSTCKRKFVPRKCAGRLAAATL